MKYLYILFLFTPFFLLAQLSWQKTNGPFGGTIEGFAAKPTGEFYAVNSSGLYKSTDNGENWFLITENVLNINTVEIGPTGRIYLGTDYRGVWWSDNEGISWSNNQITHNSHTGLGTSVTDIKINSAGHIFVSRYRSMNGGSSWFELSIYSSDFLFLTGNEILAATNQGVQKSNDNGSSWSLLNNGMGNIQVNCISKSSSGLLFAGTSNGGIYISNNNGNNWVQSNSGLSNLSVLELGADSDDRIFASTLGGIFISTNNGSTWQKLNLGVEPGLFYDFDIINGKELFSSTQKYGLLRSSDNGLSWDTSHNGIPVLNSKNLVTNESGIYLNANGTIYFSANAGNTWDIINSAPYAITSLETSSAGNIFAGTINSGLFNSSDNGINWTNIVIPEVLRIDYIAVDNSSRITISSNGRLHHSSDSGLNWNQVFNSDTALFIPGFLVVNNNGSMFYGGFTFFVEEVIFYSDDFGLSWNKINFGTSNHLFSLYSDGEIIYASFQDHSIKYSADNGQTWQVYPTIPFGSPVNTMKKLNNGVFLAGTQSNGIFYTSDNGNTWNTLSSGLPSLSGFPLFISSDLNNMLYVGYFSKGIYRNDNWEVIVPVELTSFTASVNGKNVLLEWVTSSEINNNGFEVEKFQISNLKSQDWEKIGFIPGNGTTTETQTYSFKDENLIRGSYQYRLKQIDFDGTFKYSNIIEIGIDFIPDEYVLYQNYPNPFNPNTIIKFSVPSSGLITLKIFDILGNEVAVLINDIKEAGFHETEFNAAEHSSGTYLYQIKAGDFVQTKKLLLLK